MAAQTCYNCNAPIANISSQFCANCGEITILKQQYHIKKVLGQGGFGTVYLAQDLNNNRNYALKIIRSTSVSEQRQLSVEVDILTKHSHEFAFIPTIHDTWSERFQTFIVMEYIEGRTLEQLQTSPWPPREVFNLLQTLLKYLQQLHNVGVIHRDIKPSNIILTDQGHYKLIDFGISKQGSFTRTVARKVGTLEYSSLEQAQGMPTDEQSDIYSLAATAYHLLTGKEPVYATQRKNGMALPRPSSIVKNIPQELEKAILYMMEVDKKDRPTNCNDALVYLEKAAKPTLQFAKTTQGITSNTSSQNKTNIVIAVIGGSTTLLVAVVGLFGQIITTESKNSPAVAIERSIYTEPTRAPLPTSAPPTRAPLPTSAPPTRAPLPTSAPPTSAPVPTESTNTGEFRGINGKARLDWSIDGLPYIAVIETVGTIGIVDVVFYDATIGASVVVREQLTLTEFRGIWFYVASNPIYLATGTPANYASDIFRLDQLSNGSWTIGAVCDTQYACAIVTTTPMQ